MCKPAVRSIFIADISIAYSFSDRNAYTASIAI